MAEWLWLCDGAVLLISPMDLSLSLSVCVCVCVCVWVGGWVGYVGECGCSHVIRHHTGPPLPPMPPPPPHRPQRHTCTHTTTHTRIAQLHPPLAPPTPSPGSAASSAAGWCCSGRSHTHCLLLLVLLVLDHYHLLCCGRWERLMGRRGWVVGVGEVGRGRRERPMRRTGWWWTVGHLLLLLLPLLAPAARSGEWECVGCGALRWVAGV